MLRRTDSPPSRQELLALAGFLEEALSHIQAGEKQAVRHYAELERRLLDVENSRFLRTLQWPGRFLGDWKGRLGQILLHSPWHPLYLKLAQPHFTADRYRLWVESEQTPGERRRVREPLISLILPAVSYTHLDVYKRQGRVFSRTQSQGRIGSAGDSNVLFQRDDPDARIAICILPQEAGNGCIMRAVVGQA